MHVRRVCGVGQVALLIPDAYDAFSIRYCRNATTRLLVARRICHPPEMTAAAHHHGSGSAEQMFGEKQQIPPAEQSDQEAECMNRAGPRCEGELALGMPH